MCLFAHRRYVCVCVNYINNLDHDLAGWSEGRLATTNHHSSSIHSPESLLYSKLCTRLDWRRQRGLETGPR